MKNLILLSCLALFLLACEGGRVDEQATRSTPNEAEARAVSSGDGQDAEQLYRHFNQHTGDEQ